jgi:hypothetical protein
VASRLGSASMRAAVQKSAARTSLVNHSIGTSPRRLCSDAAVDRPQTTTCNKEDHYPRQDRWAGGAQTLDVILEQKEPSSATTPQAVATELLRASILNALAENLQSIPRR